MVQLLRKWVLAGRVGFLLRATEFPAQRLAGDTHITPVGQHVSQTIDDRGAKYVEQHGGRERDPGDPMRSQPGELDPDDG